MAKWNRAVSINGEVWIDGVRKKNFPANIIPKNTTGFIFIDDKKKITFISDEDMDKPREVANA